MKLIKCYIENFGLLHATEFSFSKSLNCCISDNGTGKTTLTAFIEAMLYGIGDTRRQSLDENARKKYMPWQGGKFGGSLTIEAGKKKYVIERSFGQKAADDTFRLIDADSGRISYDFGEDIGEKLFGIDRDGFLRTVFLSEKNLQGKNDNKSISAKLSDLVGVDGDVGGFDDAIKLLEDRRKFYFKKGNTGEIANVKERIAEKDRELGRIGTLKSEAAFRETRLAELNAERSRLSLLETEQRGKLESIHRQKERGAHEERYAAMLAALRSESERLESAKKFFESGIPTPVEIDSARDKYIEAKRLKGEALAKEGNEEFVSLGEFFKNGTDFVEIADVERRAELMEERRAELCAIDADFDPISREMRSLFKDQRPSKEDIERMKKAKKGGKKIIAILGFTLGAAIAAAGAILGQIYGYAMIGVGAVMAVAGLVFAIKPSKSKELLSLFRQFGVEDSKNATAAIEELERNLTRYESLEAEKEQKRALANEEYCSLTLAVCSFLEKFPKTDASSMLESVRLIKSKYAQYYALSTSQQTSESSKVNLLKRSDELLAQVSEFLGKFPTETTDPFSEIRDMLTSYNYLARSVSNLNRECDEFAVRYNVTGKNTGADAEEENAIRSAVNDLSERLKALSGEYAVTERELYSIRDALEREDEIRMEKEELEDLYKKHVKSLDVIKKTSLYLGEACDNITSKYLGKTKEKFLEYSKLILGIEGEYSLSTSFELSKTERGEAHGIESYSRGTRDLYALGLRLALIDALYEKESPFIILDDPFIALDDAKLERAKAMLKALGKSKQILYFTCAKSRAIE